MKHWSVERKFVSSMRRRTFLSSLMTLSALASCSTGEKKKPLLTGDRTNILASRSALNIDHQDESPITLPPLNLVNQWPQSGRIPSHIGENYSWGGLKPFHRHVMGAGAKHADFMAWAALGSYKRSLMPCTPVMANNCLVVMDGLGHVHCFSWPKLRKLWSFNPRPQQLQSSNIGGGLGIKDDCLYVVDGISQVICLSLGRGNVRWRASINTPGRSSPTIVGDRLFVGTIDEAFYCLDIKTGRQLWRYLATPTETTVFGLPAPAVADGIVVAGFGSGELIAFRAESGEVVWDDMLGAVSNQASTLNLSCVRGKPVITNDIVYAASMAQVMVAVDIKTGRRVWERALASQDDPLCVGEWLFIVSLDQTMVCLDRYSGHVRWMTKLPRYKNEVAGKGAIEWFGPLLANGKLVCISNVPQKGMIIVDPQNGHIVSMNQLHGMTWLPPIIVDGKMLVITNDGGMLIYGG